MRLTRIGLCFLATGAFALASGASAGELDEPRLDGFFSTAQDGQASDGDNEACLDFDDDDDTELEGEVRAISGGCTARIRYDTDSYNKASGSLLKPGKTKGTAKLSQQLFVDMEAELFDTDGIGLGVCTEAFFAEGRPEKCSAKSSLKGTQVADTVPGADEDNDTADSNKVSAKCELGDGLDQLDTDSETAGIQPPSADQVAALVAAFADRKDVKIDEKGRLNVTHDGVPDTTTPFCGD